MKNLFTYGSLIAMLLFTFACSKEDQDPAFLQDPAQQNIVAVSDQEAIAAGIPANEVAKFSNPQNFRTRLKGAFEVPWVDTEALGIALFRYNADSSKLYYVLAVNHIKDVTASHIHIAPAGENGAVVAFLFSGPMREGNFAGILAKGHISSSDLVGSMEGMSLQDLIEEMQMGNAYVNVHTMANPSGEIRGQIR